MRNAYGFLAKRDLHQVVKETYTILKQIKRTVFFCWFGTKYYITGERLLALFAELDILNNVAYNIGFMWTDIVMLLVAVPGQTENDLLYYYAFYVGDFIFRFIFK